jgi:hypothetical protein
MRIREAKNIRILQIRIRNTAANSRSRKLTIQNEILQSLSVVYSSLNFFFSLESLESVKTNFTAPFWPFCLPFILCIANFLNYCVLLNFFTRQTMTFIADHKSSFMVVSYCVWIKRTHFLQYVRGNLFC